jgi:outer membrane protein
MIRPTLAIAWLSALAWIVAIAPAAHAERVLSLTQAVQIALENSPDVASAEHRVAAARAGLHQTEAVFYPHLRVSEAYAATNNPVQAFTMTLAQRAFSFNADFNDPPTTDNFNTQVLATYSLYNGGTDLARRQAAELGLEERERRLDAARNDLVFEVQRAYHTVGKARRLVAAAQATVESMQASVDLARRRHERGAALKTDVLDAEVRLARAREDLVQARSGLSQSETLLRQVLGLGEGADVTAADFTPSAAAGKAAGAGGAVLGASSGAEQDSAGAEAADVRGRAEWRAAEAAVRAAERGVRAARGAHLPRIGAFAGYELDSGDASDFEDSWLAGVRVELDVFDGFSTSGKVAEAEAELQAARAALRKVELGLQAEVERAKVAVEDARARLATTASTVAQAKESLAIVKDRYGSGLALLTQVLDAEAALTAARQRRIAAEADQRIAMAALDRALGRSWVSKP